MFSIQSTFLAVLLLPLVSGQENLLQKIKAEPTLTEFAKALALTGLDELLGGVNGEVYTVFPPSNAAIAGDPNFATYMTQDGWIKHLTANIQFMIVPNEKLSDADIFDQVTTQLQSLNGTLTVSQPYAEVNLVRVTTPNNEGSNGVYHIMEGVVKPYWRASSLWHLSEHDELAALGDIIERIKFDQPLLDFVPTGTSWIAARNRGYGDDSIAKGYYPIVEELMDNSTEGEAFQNFTYMYNLVDQNFYEENIQNVYQLRVKPRNAVADMWITKDQNGILRFNDAVLDRQALSDNGVTQIVDKPLVAPGLAMVMGFCADFTTINLKDMYQYYVSSGWNLRNLTRSIGTDQGSFNVFAPLQDGFGSFNIEVGVRISTLEWERHLWDFLLHLTVEPARTSEEWTELVKDNGGKMSVKMLSGFPIEMAIIDEELTINKARIIGPYDMQGVDGYIHLVEEVPLPPSVLYTVYDQTEQNPEMSAVTNLIDTVKLGVFIDNLLPVTFFSAVNAAWDVLIPTLEIEDVLKNMIFELLWFDDELADMHGDSLKSANGKVWNIEVYDNPNGAPLLYRQNQTAPFIYFSNAEGPAGLTNCSFIPGPNRTNILARTGVIHHIDCLFLDYNYTKAPPLSPTFAPLTKPPAAPTPSAVFTTMPQNPTEAPVFTLYPVASSSWILSCMMSTVMAVAAALFI